MARAEGGLMKIVNEVKYMNILYIYNLFYI